jgi:(1->4)-alpha-D-glucan 1-alpha-D-glucosylmutase
MIAGTKREIADTSQAAEVGRLIRCLPDAVRAHLGDDRARDAFAELLAAFPVYRAYLPAGRELLADAVATASARRPTSPTPSSAGGARRRCGRRAVAALHADHRPVMAKGVEDRAFYRYTRLTRSPRSAATRRGSRSTSPGSTRRSRVDRRRGRTRSRR